MPYTIDLRKNKAEQAPKEAPVFNKPETNSPPQERPAEISSEQISWQTYLGNNLNKGMSLIIALIFFTGAIVIIYLKYDFILAILFFVAGVSILIFSGQKRKLSQITVSDSGVFINNRKFGYLELRSFWIDYQPGMIKELSLEVKKWHYPYIKIPLDNQNPLKIRNILIEFISEKEHKKSLLDLVLNRVGI